MENSVYLKFFILFFFIICYTLIILENFLKIKRVEISLFFSGFFIIILALFSQEKSDYLNNKLLNFLYEYCQLFLFLFVAMIYINALKLFNFFEFIKNLIILKKMSYRKIYFLSGIISFFISPIADNLTTSLLMSSIILNINVKNKNFINLSCINIVVASNAGGVFSPFGDITTLMIWQSGLLDFFIFFKLFFPSFFSFIIPSVIMCNYIPKKHYLDENTLNVINGFKIEFKFVFFLFFITIFFAVLFQSYLNIPPVFGMVFGLSFLQFYFIFKKINFFHYMTIIEWESLLFFYGIMLCICSLDFIGILKDLSDFLYLDNFIFGNNYTWSNILIGILSALIDNIPITFSLINMKLSMSDGQWLLLTYTVATGGSLLSIGSAAGIAVMSKARNIYTFYSHLKWSFVIFIGYISGVLLHLFINKDFF